MPLLSMVAQVSVQNEIRKSSLRRHRLIEDFFAMHTFTYQAIVS